MRKRAVALVLLLAMMLFVAAPAFAAVPANTIVVGNKGWDMDYAVLHGLVNQILNEIQAAGGRFIQYIADGVGIDSAKFEQALVAGTAPNLNDAQAAAAWAQANPPENLPAQITLYNEQNPNGTAVNTGAQVQLEVTSVKAVSAKALEVTFSKAVENTAALSFTVQRGTSPVVLDVSWNQAKTAATLSSSTNLVAGTYTVTVSGADFAEGKNGGSVTVEAQKVARIEFTSTVIVKTGTQTGTIGYKVFDQYGQDVTKETVAANIQWTASQGTATDINAGTITFNKGSDFAAGDSFVITGIDPASGTTVSATFTVGAEAVVQSLTLGEISLPGTNTRIFTGLNPAARIALTGQDQYGNVLSKYGDFNGKVTVVSSDSAVVATLTDKDGGNDGTRDAAITINTSGLTTAKSVTITVISNGTGRTASKTLEIVKPSAPATVSLTAPSGVIAAGDGVGTLVIPLTVQDQFGATLTADQVAAVASTAFTITSSNSSVIASNQLKIETTGANKGKLVNTAAISGTGTTTITVTVNETGRSDSITLTAQAARHVAQVSLPDTLVGNMLQGATQTFGVKFKDQYGADFVPTSNDGNYKVNVAITKVSGDDVGLDVTPKGDITDETSVVANNAFTLTADAYKTGTYTLTVKLINTSGETVSQASKTITVAAATSSLSYSIKDIPVLYKGAGSAASPYAEKVEVIATDASGNSYAINPSDILSITSDKTEAAVDSASRKVYGNNSGLNNDVTATITVVFNTKDDVKTLTKSVTVSSAGLAAQKVYIVDKAVDATNLKLATGTTEISTVNAVYESGSWSVSQAVYAGVLDQFGRVTQANASGKAHAVVAPTVTNMVNLTGNPTVSVDASTGEVKITLTGVDFAADKTSGSFRVVLTTPNGKVGYFNVQAIKK
ncbi:MAG: hypothetical protein D9V47_06285 [Clostridia bacterium]|nr:MAG: hypothetical protein D9V47_06285 [Clostridia bacterium]